MARRTCFDCDHVDEREVKDKKVWCRSYKMYCYPEDADKCKRFEMTSGSSTGGCYLTTACVEHKGLPDNCMELTTLREFRDGYLAHTKNGLAEIGEYYETAPYIVESINKREDANAVYEDIYSNVIIQCVELIQKGKNEDAHRKYKEMVESLKEKYC